MTWWIPLIFVAGFVVSMLGLIAAISEHAERGVTIGLVTFAVFALFFGLICAQWLFAPLLIRPRIVPYFVRQLSEYGGATTAAFRRGRALYHAMGPLERLATTLHVTPLSAFGFAYDFYDQNVQWHAPANAISTIDALRAALDPRLTASAGLREDLDALASVLRTAADQSVDFCLIVRLHARESMQAVFTRESRQGSFW